MRTITFNSTVSLAHENVKTAKFSSIASADTLADLRKLLPDQSEIDENSDIVFFCGNAAVLGLTNLNGVAMPVDVGIAIANSYKRKAINYGHDRYTNIGYIEDVSFSTFPDSKLVTNDEAAQLPIVNTTISGLLWKVAAGGIANDVFMCDSPGSEYDKYFGFSWEIAFTEYGVALGSKNLSRAKVITEPDEVAKYDMHLRENGGSGFLDDGTEIYMVITDKSAKCLSVAVTPSPAAAVEGIVTKKTLASDATAEIKSTQEEILSKIEETVKKTVASILEEKNIKKDENSFSQQEKLNVKTPQHMKSFHNKEEIQTLLTNASIDVETQKGLFEFLEGCYKAEAEKYQAQQTSAKELAEVASAQTKVEQEKVAKLEQTVQDLVAQLNENIAAQEEVQKKVIFEKRLSALASEFDLSSEKTHNFVSKQIKDLSETDYKTWYEEIASLLPAKSKPVVTPAEATKAIEETKASVETLPNSQEIAPTEKYAKLKGAHVFTFNKSK